MKNMRPRIGIPKIAQPNVVSLIGQYKSLYEKEEIVYNSYLYVSIVSL